MSDAFAYTDKRMHDALYEVLGQGHVLRSAIGDIRRWHADPNFKLGPELQRVEDATREWHRRLVEAANPGWHAVVEPRDYCMLTYLHEKHGRCDGSVCPPIPRPVHLPDDLAKVLTE